MRSVSRGPQRSVLPARLSVSKQRLRNRGKNRSTIGIRFRLSQDSRVVLVLRGPGPSCAAAGRLAIRGQKGLNRVRFNGLIGRRFLRPGTYLVTPLGRKPRLGQVLITILPAKGAALNVTSRPRCLDSTTETANAAIGRAFGVEAPSTSRPSGGVLPLANGAAEQAANAKNTLADSKSSPSSSGVLGAILSPPLPAVTTDSGRPSAFGIAILATLLLLLVAIFVEVSRQLRRPQT